MVECKLIGFFPSVADQGGHQEQQGAFGLVEVGDQPSDDSHLVGGSDHQGGGGFYPLQLVLVEVGEDVLKGLAGGELWVGLVGIPLLHVEVAQCHPLFFEHHANPIQAFEGACAGGADGNNGVADVLD